MAPINSGSFTRDGDKISLMRLRARPAVYRSHLLCNLRQLSKPWSPPADITTSKLSPSVRADSTMKSCPSISVDISASSSGTPSATAVAVTASCDSTANDKAPRTFREHTRHVVLDLLGPHVEVFFSAREHWWLSQAFRVNKHPSRRCLCTVQHRRDCSRQFCKTLCNVLLSSQLSFECSVLIRQSAHLLLQRSQRIFHFWMFGSSATLSRVGSHARAKGFQRSGTDKNSLWLFST